MAREVAAEMGLLEVPSDDIAKEDPPLVDFLIEAVGGNVNPQLVAEEAVSASQQDPGPEHQAQSNTQIARAGQILHSEALIQAASSVPCPPILNKRLAFNPRNRHTTKAQKREILRRDGWCCSTPSCPHKIWLHIHHLTPYSEGGPTLPRNVVGLCTGCHTNVHHGTLKIHPQNDGTILFTDAQGNSLAKQADLEIGSWLDYHIGWEGAEDGAFQRRAWAGDWAVFDRVGLISVGPARKRQDKTNNA